MLIRVRGYAHDSLAHDSLAHDSLARVTVASRTRVKAGRRSGAQHMSAFIIGMHVRPTGEEPSPTVRPTYIYIYICR
jgi:hypothetical protein